MGSREAFYGQPVTCPSFWSLISRQWGGIPKPQSMFKAFRTNRARCQEKVPVFDAGTSAAHDVLYTKESGHQRRPLCVVISEILVIIRWRIYL